VGRNWRVVGCFSGPLHHPGQDELRALREDFAKMQAKQLKIDSLNKIMNDPIHEAEDCSSRSGSQRFQCTPSQKIILAKLFHPEVKDPPPGYLTQDRPLICPLCEKTHITGFAHLLAGTVNTRPQLVTRLNAAYAEPFDPQSFRNFIPMCGSHPDAHNHEGVHTCHHLFDTKQFFLAPSMTRQIYRIHSVHPDADHLHDKSFSLPYEPYLRALAGRAKIAIKKYSFQDCVDMENAATLVDFSDQSLNKVRPGQSVDTSGNEPSSTATVSTSTARDTQTKQKCTTKRCSNWATIQHASDSSWYCARCVEAYERAQPKQRWVQK